MNSRGIPVRNPRAASEDFKSAEGTNGRSTRSLQLTQEETREQEPGAAEQTVAGGWLPDHGGHCREGVWQVESSPRDGPRALGTESGKTMVSGVAWASATKQPPRLLPRSAEMLLGIASHSSRNLTPSQCFSFNLTYFLLGFQLWFRSWHWPLASERSPLVRETVTVRGNDFPSLLLIRSKSTLLPV